MEATAIFGVVGEFEQDLSEVSLDSKNHNLPEKFLSESEIRIFLNLKISEISIEKFYQSFMASERFELFLANRHPGFASDVTKRDAAVLLVKGWTDKVFQPVFVRTAGSQAAESGESPLENDLSLLKVSLDSRDLKTLKEFGTVADDYIQHVVRDFIVNSFLIRSAKVVEMLKGAVERELVVERRQLEYLIQRLRGLQEKNIKFVDLNGLRYKDDKIAAVTLFSSSELLNYYKVRQWHSMNKLELLQKRQLWLKYLASYYKTVVSQLSSQKSARYTAEFANAVQKELEQKKTDFAVEDTMFVKTLIETELNQLTFQLSSFGKVSIDPVKRRGYGLPTMIVFAVLLGFLLSLVYLVCMNFNSTKPS